MSENNIVIIKICKTSILPHSFTLNDFFYVVQYSYKMLYNNLKTTEDICHAL